MNTQRILEQVIAATIIGAIVLYGTVQVLGNDIKGIKEDVQRIEKRQDQIYKDIYRPTIPGRRNQ